MTSKQEPPLKKRLLGAVVLVILAVILIPPLVEESAIPPVIIPAMPTPPPFSVAPARIIQPTLHSSSAEERATGANAPMALPSWIIQVASFTQLNNARRLIQQLRVAKLQTPAAEKLQIQGTTYYRVRVGPFLDQATAQGILSLIQKVRGVKPQIVAYP